MRTLITLAALTYALPLSAQEDCVAFANAASVCGFEVEPTDGPGLVPGEEIRIATEDGITTLLAYAPLRGRTPSLADLPVRILEDLVVHRGRAPITFDGVTYGTVTMSEGDALHMRFAATAEDGTVSSWLITSQQRGDGLLTLYTFGAEAGELPIPHAHVLTNIGILP